MKWSTKYIINLLLIYYSPAPDLRRVASHNQSEIRADITSIEAQERVLNLQLEQQKLRTLQLKNDREELELQKLRREIGEQ